MTFIIGAERSDACVRAADQPWPGSVVAPQERSFQPAEPTGNFRPAGERYRALSEAERDALIEELALALSTCRPEVQSRMINGFTAVDPDYGRRVAEALTGQVSQAELQQ